MAAISAQLRAFLNGAEHLDYGSFTVTVRKIDDGAPMQVLVIFWEIAFHFYKIDPIFDRSIARLMEAKTHIK